MLGGYALCLAHNSWFGHCELVRGTQISGCAASQPTSGRYWMRLVDCALRFSSWQVAQAVIGGVEQLVDTTIGEQLLGLLQPNDKHCAGRPNAGCGLVWDSSN